MSDQRRPGESILEYARRRAVAQGFPVSEPTVAPSATQQFVEAWDDDLIPDPGPTAPRSKERIEMDAVLRGIDIVEAYNRWCGKMQCDPGSKTESIMVSCPNPMHPDTHPSAWLTLNKGEGGVGNCPTCVIDGNGGFDKYDIAAWRFGFNVPGYKSKEDFPQLREKMAEDLGYQVIVEGKDEWLVKVEPDPAPTPDTSAPSSSSSSPDPSPTTYLPGPTSSDDDAPDDEPETSKIGRVIDGQLDVVAEGLFLDWRKLPAIHENTFLDHWMHAMSKSYEPDEYYLFEGLVALAAAAGNNVTHIAPRGKVRPNLMVCVVGPTGAGKSISMSYLADLLNEAMPFDKQVGSGVRMIASAGSGEALLDEFSHSITDASTGTTQVVPINGICKENELASVMKRIQRSGNTSREIMMDLFDFARPVSITSRGSGGVVEARDHFMQMVAGTQPASIRRQLTDADAAAGFLNRWVFVFGPAKPAPAVEATAVDMKSSIESIRKVRAWGSPGREVAFHDQDAIDLWTPFHDNAVQPLTLVEDAWMAARLPLLARKILLLLAINDRATTITVDHVQTLIMMWPYLLRCYGIIEGHVGQDDMDVAAEAIEKYMKGRDPDKPVTFRQIHKNSGARRFNKELVLKAIDVLKRGGFVEEAARAKSDQVARYAWVPEDRPAHIPNLSVINGGRTR
jgi:hypothetical protein